MESYKSATRGAIPTTDVSLKTFIQGYLKGSGNTAGTDYVDPQKGNYVFKIGVAPSEPGDISYYPSKNCDGQAAEGVADAGSREYAFTMKLEGQNVPFCVGTTK